MELELEFGARKWSSEMLARRWSWSKEQELEYGAGAGVQIRS